MDSIFSEKHFGIISIAILLMGLLFLIKKWPKSIHHTFSQHATTSKASIIYYISLFTITLPLLAIFLLVWFVPMFNVPMVFIIFISLSLICQYACTFVPEIGANIKNHQLLAGISGLLLLPSLVVLLYIPGLDFMDKIITLISIVIMIGIVLRVIDHKSKYALLLQSVYFIAFFTPIIVIAYI
jgi:hypothetical protein